MTDRYSKTFERLRTAQSRPGFCPFAVLGHPTPQESLKRIEIYLNSGADFLELGIPFSDPIADGPVIQHADELALKNGTTPHKALQIISQVRKLANPKAKQIPIGILTYSNIVLKYGISKFYQDLKNSGADSILIADAPLEEIQPFAKAAKRHQLHQIFIVSENTTPARINQIQKYASGFLYVVSTLGITGERKSLNPKINLHLTTLQKHTRLPLLVGFGISSSSQIRQLSRLKINGLIVGSTLVKTATKNLQKKIIDLQNAVM